MRRQGKGGNGRKGDGGGAGGLWEGIIAAAALTLTTVGLVWAGKKIKKAMTGHFREGDAEKKTRYHTGPNGYREFYVSVDVKHGHEGRFLAAVILNRNATKLEPGNQRYDIYRSITDRTKFILHEVYSSSEAESEHRTTPHYRRWRDEVAEMMARPRRRDAEGIPHGYEIVP